MASDFKMRHHQIAGAGGIKNADFRTATIKFLTRPEPVGYYDGEEPATK